jgi:hypothetical protein
MLKSFDKQVVASSNSHATHLYQIFTIINFKGSWSLFFTINPTFIDHPLVFYLFYRQNHFQLST